MEATDGNSKMQANSDPEAFIIHKPSAEIGQACNHALPI